MLGDVRDEWPMDCYVSAWKTFRSMADENERTASHLLSRPHWPKGGDYRIADIGCGDGKLITELLIRSPFSVSGVTLVDPDGDLLDEAVAELDDKPLTGRIEKVLGTAQDHFEGVASRCDVALAVHLVYLMPNGAFSHMLHELPRGVPLFVVMDAPTSVFTSLWERTALKYHGRATSAHETIASLNASEFEVSRSSINSTIRDPLAIERPELRLAVLSLLSYSDMKSIGDPALLGWIENVLRNHTVDGRVVCESFCYEIMRR